MADKPRVRPGFSSSDPSQDVEFTIDRQIDEGQHERDEKEGPLGPPKTDRRFESNRPPLDVDEQHEETPAKEKQQRGTPP